MEHPRRLRIARDRFQPIDCQRTSRSTLLYRSPSNPEDSEELERKRVAAAPVPCCGSWGRSHPSIGESLLSTRKTASPRKSGRISDIMGRKTDICTLSKARPVGVLDSYPLWALDEPSLVVVQSCSPNGIPPLPAVRTRASGVDNRENVDSPLERNDPPPRGNDSPFEWNVPPQKGNGSPPGRIDSPPEVSGSPSERTGSPRKENGSP
jgi:hypothetical protein